MPPQGIDTFLLGKPLAQKLLNATSSLPDETGLIAVRGKQITLRHLDKVKLAEQRRRWQLLNLGAPLLLLGAFGAVRAWRRKRHHAGLLHKMDRYYF